MPQQGSRPKRAGSCPACHGPNYYTIFWRDGFGREEALETHCNQCGYALDGEGNLRSKPTNEALMMTLRGKEL